MEADGIVYVTSGFRGNAAWAIRLSEAKGNIEGTAAVLWEHHRDTPYVPSPLLYGKSIYYLRHYQGILTRLRAKTGQEKGGPFRLGLIRDVYSSPVAAADRVYITDRLGVTLVISHSDDENPKALSQNRLNDRFSASAAIVGRELFLRGEKYLYCIARDDGND